MRRVFLALAVAALLGGCGTKAKAPDSGTPAVNAPPIDTRQPQAAAGTPGAVVLRLWTYLRERAYPVALSTYDPGTVKEVGEENLLGGFSAAQPTIDGYAPRIVRVRSVEARRGNTPLALVSVVAKATAGGTSGASFLLRRNPRGWTIIYDSLLDGAMRGYYASARESSPDPKTRLPADQAVQAAAALSRRYERQASAIAKGAF